MVDALRVGVQQQEFGYTRQFALLIFVYIFVAHKKEAVVSQARCQPTVDAVGPGPDTRPRTAVHPTRNPFLNRAAFANRTHLQLPVIVGNGHVARIAHNVDDPGVTGVEGLMAFDQARTREAAQHPVGVLVHVGNKTLHVEESNGLIRVDEIADQKTHPGGAGTRVGRDENVVVENGDFTLDQGTARQHVINSG